MPGFEGIVNNLLHTSHGENMAFAILVEAGGEQQVAWEAFAYDYYYNIAGYPNTTAVSSDDARGIWAWNTTVQNGTQPKEKEPQRPRYHDTGTPNYPTRYPNMLVPTFQVNEGADPGLLYNLHAAEHLGRAIEEVIDCVNNTSTAAASSTPASTTMSSPPPSSPHHNERRLATTTTEWQLTDEVCGRILGMVDMDKFSSRGPTSIIFQPVRPAQDPTVVSVEAPCDAHQVCTCCAFLTPDFSPLLLLLTSTIGQGNCCRCHCV